MKLDTVRQQIQQRMEDAKRAQRRLGHILLCGTPYQTQQVLSVIRQQALNPVRVAFAPVFERQGDLAAVLTQLKEGGILYLNDIHLLPSVCIPLLSGVMLDFVLDVVVGSTPNEKYIRMNLPRFTLIGATTRPAFVSYLVRRRFEVEYSIEYYS